MGEIEHAIGKCHHAVLVEKLKLVEQGFAMWAHRVDIRQVHYLDIEVRQNLVQVLRAFEARQGTSFSKVGVHEDDVEASDGKDSIVAQCSEGALLDTLVQ